MSVSAPYKLWWPVWPHKKRLDLADLTILMPSDLTCLLTAVWPLFLSSLSVTSLSSLLLSSLCSTVFSNTITLTCTQQQLGLDHVKSHLVTFLTNKLIFEFQAKYGCKLNTIFVGTWPLCGNVMLTQWNTKYKSVYCEQSSASYYELECLNVK